MTPTKSTTSTSWVVMKISNITSKHNGNPVQVITFANVHGEIAHTYIDETNNNYDYWKNIIRGYDEGFGIIVTGLKIKPNKVYSKTGEPLINADSSVKVVHVEESMDTLLDEFVRELGL